VESGSREVGEVRAYSNRREALEPGSERRGVFFLAVVLGEEGGELGRLILGQGWKMYCGKWCCLYSVNCKGWRVLS